MFKILIYLENKYVENCIDLIEVANLVGSGKEYETYGLCINNEENIISDLDYKININNTDININSIKNISKVMKELNDTYCFDCILMLATNTGRMLAPRLAMTLKTGLVADVTKIENDGERIIMVRPAFDGKIMAGIICDKTKPIMMTIRPHAFKSDDKKTILFDRKVTKQIEYRIKNNYTTTMKLVGKIEKIKNLDITKSEVLVSGGGGVIDDFNRLDSLAKMLGGQTSASRRIVDSGIASRSIQVGQSGKTVSPKLYFALGIYGSLQHIEGLKNIESIISVNTDKDAPICSISDIVVEGDALEFVDRLVKRIDKGYSIDQKNI